MNSKIVNIIIWSLIGITLVVLLGFVHKKQDEMLFNEPVINIDYETENRFVSRQDVLNQVMNLDDSLARQLGSFDASEIENKVSNNSAIKTAEVYKTIDGKLVINVKQRRPIVRVYTSDENYYLDDQGYLMPISKKYTARVLVVNGFINDAYGKGSSLNFSDLDDSLAGQTLLDDVYKVALYLDNSTFWKAQIEQVYVNKDLEFELIPKVGNHKIVLGGVEQIDQKFEKLMIFYQKGLKKTGWNEYSEINLKYKDQVVCKKNYN